MSLKIDDAAFARGHEAFLAYMQQKSRFGAPFTSFHHDFLASDELEYKYAAHLSGTEALQSRRWSAWRKTPGKILEAVSQACSQKSSRNLLEHRWGGSYEALDRARKAKKVQGIEDQLYAFFTGGHARADFAPRFDAFASYLRENRLGCPWPFPTYLAFLLDPHVYFPVRPQRMQRLLHFYGVDQKLSKHVAWERYTLLLELADVLRDKLVAYGPASAIELQSYMWEVGYLLERDAIPSRRRSLPVNFDDELQRRIQAAQQRERRGLAGERYVFEREQLRLRRAGRADLASRVELTSATGAASGFDVRSFEMDGTEIHIEVKTTASTADVDSVFFLSESERRCAEADAQWTVYRVTGIDVDPKVEVLGNVVVHGHAAWEMTASAWIVSRRASSTVG
jgi:hypothetical protein